jgi:murein DD-endopeptidase MepM/ murein hydrolase activator NlpD
VNRVGIVVALLLSLGLIGFASIVRVTGPRWSGVTGKTNPPVPTPASPTDRLVVPVQGVAPEALLDSWADPRGGGTRVHHAIDIAAPVGTPVLAAADGKIEKLFESRLGGNTIYERSADGNIVFYYAHLDRYAPTLAEGQVVTAGQPIASIGATGDADPGAPHLHFEIHRMAAADRWWQGTELNPYSMFRGGNR